MTLNDQELAKIVKNRTPVIIDNKQFIIESNPIGSCDGCYYLDKIVLLQLGDTAVLMAEIY